jgi:hypothetical protein
MSDRLIFIGPSGSGKSTSALGFMAKPSGTAIIQHKGSQGFRYLRGIKALAAMTITDVSNFTEYGAAVTAAITGRRDLIIIDDFDYLFRDEQRNVRQGLTGNKQRLASQGIYQQEETITKALLECGATVIFTLKAVGKPAPDNMTEHGPFLPGLHAHMETGLVDGVFHFIKRGAGFVAKTKAWADQNNIWYAKATIGLGDFLPEEIVCVKVAGKPYSTSVRDAMTTAKAKLDAAFGAPETAPEQKPPEKKDEPPAPGTGPLFNGGTKP